MSTPVYLVTGLHVESMATATLGLQLDLPRAVVVRHQLDISAGHLVRTVSDLSGVLEREVVSLEHACLGCAIREDVIPTLERLAELGRWDAVVVHLPLGADSRSVCRALAGPRPDRLGAPVCRVAGVVAALEGPRVVADLLGDDLVGERLPGEAEGDLRGVGEVLASLVEYADLVTVVGGPAADDLDLLRHLARPGVPVASDWPDLSTQTLLAGVHQHTAGEQWAAEVYQGARRDAQSRFVWRMDLTTDVPLHPQRLQEEITALGGGAFRTRGCFWLASRPGQIAVWDGAGGQLSIGVSGSWGRVRPFTRLMMTGLLKEDPREQVRAAFARVQLTEAELRTRGRFWEVASDGLETWLGPTSRAA